MGFFNDLGKKTSETTSKIARETKLKLKINENKGKISKIYEEIGKEVYEAYEKGAKSNDKAIKEKCTQIDDLSSEIEEARKEILVLNHKKICSKCFAEIEEDAAFCSKCGEKQKETVFEKAEKKMKKTEVLPKNKDKKEAVKKELKEKNKKEEVKKKPAKKETSKKEAAKKETSKKGTNKKETKKK